MEITTTPYLRKAANPIIPGERWKDVVIDMIKVMHYHDGVGLAAPQVGLPYRLFVARTSLGILAVANPTLSEFTSQEYKKSLEGCLSLPGEEYTVIRPTEICLRGVHPVTGRAIEIDYTFPDTRVICHEYDHLRGVLIDSHE